MSLSLISWIERRRVCRVSGQLHVHGNTETVRWKASANCSGRLFHDRSRDVEAPFVEFRGCRQQGQLGHRVLQSGDRHGRWNSPSLCAMEVCRTGASSGTAERENATLNCIRWGTGSHQCRTEHWTCDVLYLPRPATTLRADIAVCNCRMTCVVAGSVQDGAAVVMNAVASFLRASIEAPEARWTWTASSWRSW